MPLVTRSRAAPNTIDKITSRAKGLKAAPARPHDDQHTDETDAGREPAPPADALAEEQGRAGRDGERRELQDGDGIADRHVHQRGEEQQR
jgi:hypothetical protein